MVFGMTSQEITYLIFNNGRWAIELIVFVVIFSHVWTRKGYEGLDDRLELHEVDKFYTHIISAASFLTLDAMAIWEPIIKHEISWEWKVVFSGGFLGSGAYVILAGIKKQFTTNNKT
jgi:hypothetical protein